MYDCKVFWYKQSFYNIQTEKLLFNSFDFLKRINAPRVSHPLNRNFFVLFVDRRISWAHLGTTQTNHERKGLSCVSCSNSLQQRNQFPCHYAANLFSVLPQVILILKSLTKASVIAKVVSNNKWNIRKYSMWLFKLCLYFVLPISL